MLTAASSSVLPKNPSTILSCQCSPVRNILSWLTKGMSTIFGHQDHVDDNYFKLSQPFLIDRILNFLGICNNEFETDANSLSTRPVAKGLLHRDLTGKPCKYSWKYWMAVGMLSYLQTQAAPRSWWQCIRQLVCPTNQCFHTKNHLCASDVTYWTRGSKASSTSLTRAKGLNAQAIGCKPMLKMHRTSFLAPVTFWCTQIAQSSGLAVCRQKLLSAPLTLNTLLCCNRFAMSYR